MQTLLRWTVITGSLSLVTGAVVVACGTDSPSNDAGADGATEAASCPTYSGSSSLCKALLAGCKACGPSASNLLGTSCDQASFTAHCEALSSTTSAVATEVSASCATVCDFDARSTCADNVTADASPTAAQQKLGADYCATCSDGGAACAASIARMYILYSDEIVSAWDTRCLDAGACAAFAACAGSVVAEAGATQCDHD